MAESLDIADWSVSGAAEDKPSSPVEPASAVAESAGVDGADDDVHSYVTSVIYVYYC